MPELPEVETTRRGLAPHIVDKIVSGVTVRNASLRWPIPADINDVLTGHAVIELERRGKYLLFNFTHGTLLVHLGMSGSLRVADPHASIGKHDHVDIEFGHTVLRYNDPRRFGCILWTNDTPETHTLIKHLGPEPLTTDFNANYLFAKTRKRTQSIKTLIMDSRIVVGVGNIYANEALFNAGIHPLKAASKITRKQTDRLCEEIKQVLAKAIKRGGTTLRDFVGGDGKPGYFAQELHVYGRGGQACINCGKALIEKRLGQRTTVYCSACQK